jgi:signal transduction histidine kinase
MQRRLRFIFGLLALCLVGIYGFQAYWLYGSYRLAREEFRRTASQALEAVVEQQQVARTKQVFSFVLDDRNGPAIRTRPNRAGGVDSFVRVRQVPRDSLRPGQPATFRQLLASGAVGPAGQQPRPTARGTVVAMQLHGAASLDSFKRLSRRHLDSLRAHQAVGTQTNTIVVVSALPGQPHKKLTIGIPSPKLIQSLLVQTDKPRQVRPDSLASKLSRLVVSNWKNSQGTNLTQLARAYRAELYQRGAVADFKLDTVSNATVTFKAHVPGVRDTMLIRMLPSHAGYPVQTPAVSLNPVRGLAVAASFRAPRAYVLHRLAGSLAGSAVLLVLTTSCLALMLSTILRQKKLAEVKNDFINNMTHELKTPLATVSAAMEALQDFGALADPRKTDTYLTMARQEVRRLSDLVEKVLHIAVEDRPGHALPLHPEPVRLAELVAELVSRHELQAPKPVQFVVHIAPTATLLLDRLHLAGALHNLLDNATKYSGERVTIRIEGQAVAAGYQLTVADDGPGIEPGYQGAIFEQFFRVPTGNLHPVKGFGLGLYYVRQVVAGHGGRVSVRSAPGQGSAFVIWLPSSSSD